MEKKLQETYKSRGIHLDEEDVHRRIAGGCRVGILEIGVLEGYTSEILIKSAAVDVPIWGVDPLVADSMNKNLIGNIKKIRARTEDHSNYTFIRDFSQNVSVGWERELDYLFIDGDHNYDAVLRDFTEWLPFVISGGYVGIHDSAANRGGPLHWEGPSRLADEIIENDNYFGSLEYIETVYCLTLFRKS